MTEKTRPVRRPPHSKTRRLGPRPLPLHLLTAGTTWQSSLLALPLLKHGLPGSNPALKSRAEHLAHELAAAEPALLLRAIEAEIHTRAEALATGIRAYQQHPYQRQTQEPPPIWQEGTTTLIDYGPPNGKPVLIIPSLINRAYIFDLMPERSMLRGMMKRGLRPLLVNWHAPGPVERAFDLTAYVAGRLELVLESALDLVGGPISVIGYCMGGLLAMALATRRRRDISRLALLATPWDFHVPELHFSGLIGAMSTALCANFSALGEIPTDVLQCLFAAGDPHLAMRKFTRFSEMDMESDAASRFVAMEDWANDGVPLALPVAQECLSGWYGENQPATGNWRVAGRPVEPHRFDRPALIVVPARDRLVPPASAEALTTQLPQAEILRPDLGHIGIIVSTAAKNAVWAPLTQWLLDQ